MRCSSAAAALCLTRKEKKNLFLTLTPVTKCQDLKQNLRQMSHSQHGTVHPHTVCVHTVFQRATEEARGRFLLVPLGHLLTLSLDLSEFGLRGELCDAFHSNAFEKYCSLGGRRRKTESWTENKDTPSHSSRRNISNAGNTLQTAVSLPYESLCAETAGWSIISVALLFVLSL